MNLSKATYFTVENLSNRTNRIDAHFFNPKYYETLSRLEKLTDGKIVKPLRKLLADSKTRLTGGATPLGATYVPEGIPFIRVQNVKECKLEVEKAVRIPRIIHEKMLRRSKLKPNDVLLTITGVTYGISAVVPDDIEEANMNQHSVKMEVDDKIILPYYLCHFLNSEMCKLQMDRAVTGGTRPALDYSAIGDLRILFPKDIDKQYEISQETRGMYEKAYLCLQERDHILSTLDSLIFDILGLVLPEEFSTKYSLANISQENRLDAIAHSPYREALTKLIQSGDHEKLGKLVKQAIKKSPNFADYYKLIDMRNVEEKTGRVRITETDELDSTKLLLEKGLILVSCLNPQKGKVFLVDNRLEGCICSTEFMPLYLVSEDIDLQYLLAILRSKIVTDQWKYCVTGSTPSRERISENDVLNTLLPKPERSMQKKIGELIADKIRMIDQLEKDSALLMAKARNTFLSSLAD